MKVRVTIEGCIDIPDEWQDPKKHPGEPYAEMVADFRYNDQLTVEDAIDELAEKLKAYPDDLKVCVY